MMSEQPNPRKVSLEEVLRLKRAERPPREFWMEFEEQLRAKQLAAIVSRRPWWQVDLARLTVALRGVRFPIGAVAALAFAFVAVRENPHRASDEGHPLEIPEGLPSVGSPVASPSYLRSSAAVPTAEVAWNESSSSENLEVVEAAPVAAGTGAVVNPAPAERAASRISSLLAAIDQSPSMPRGGFVAVATLTDVPSGMLQGRSLLDSSATIEPLTQITSPSEGRRARLAALVDMPSTEPRRRSSSELRARERILDRLNEDELYLNFSRVGVDRGALSVRF